MSNKGKRQQGQRSTAQAQSSDIIGDMDEPEEASQEYAWEKISDDQKDGDQIIVSEKRSGEGTIAYWRKTRRLENFKWVEAGKWSDPMTNQTIGFEPRYYREMHSEKRHG